MAPDHSPPTRSSRLPYQADYASHPAFAPHIVWQPQDDGVVDEAVDAINQILPQLETALTLKRLTLPQALQHLTGPVRKVVDRLVICNQARGASFDAYSHRFYLEILRVLIDDLAYFERRNSHVPVLKNAGEMALRNEIALTGLLQFDLEPNELQTLRTAVRPYVDELKRRYAQGGRTREQLTAEGSDRESIGLLHQIFAGRGINKAVSDVRHEAAAAHGYGVELSPDDADWWHSRYQDAGVAQPARAAYYHNDESRDAYKAIIYLDDVTDDLGPFCYLPRSYGLERPRFEWVVSRATITTLQAAEIRGTMIDVHPTRGMFTSQVARRFFGLLPERLRVQSHFGFDVLDDSALATTIAAQEVKMVAPAGHVVVFDGSRLIHRGGLVRRGQRTALQVIFDVDKQNGRQLHTHLINALEETRHAG